MKKILCTLLAVTLMVSLAGCNNIGDTQNNVDNPSDEVNHPSDKVIEDEYDVNNTAYTVDNKILFRANIDIEHIKDIIKSNESLKDCIIGNITGEEFSDSYRTSLNPDIMANIDTIGVIVPLINKSSGKYEENRLEVAIERFRGSNTMCKFSVILDSNTDDYEKGFGFSKESILNTMEEIIKYISGAEIASKVHTDSFDEKLDGEYISTFKVKFDAGESGSLVFSAEGIYSSQSDFVLDTNLEYTIDYTKYSELANVLMDNTKNFPYEIEDFLGNVPNQLANECYSILGKEVTTNPMCGPYTQYSIRESSVPELGINYYSVDITGHLPIYIESYFDNIEYNLRLYKEGERSFDVGAYLTLKGHIAFNEPVDGKLAEDVANKVNSLISNIEFSELVGIENPYKNEGYTYYNSWSNRDDDSSAVTNRVESYIYSDSNDFIFEASVSVND